MFKQMTNHQAIGVDIGGSHVSSAIVDLEAGRLVSEVRTDPVSSKAGAEEILSVWAANISATARWSGAGTVKQLRGAGDDSGKQVRWSGAGKGKQIGMAGAGTGDKAEACGAVDGAEAYGAVDGSRYGAEACGEGVGAGIRVGFAFPGPFDYDRGISLIQGVDKFESIFSMDVSNSLRSRLDIPCVFRYVNDASAFGLGESWFGAGKASRRFLALTLGTGVGSCFIEDHKALVKGEGVPENGYVYNLPFEGGIVDESFSTRWIVKRWAQLSGETVSGALDIVRQRGTNPMVEVLFNEYGARLSRFAHQVLSDFGSDTLLLGGNLARCFGLFRAAMEEGFKDQVSDIKVQVSRLFDDAAITGAASLFKNL